VVGNLTVGGTGKTPVVEKFARALAERGRKVAILSRGYKSKRPPFWRRAWNGLTHAEEPPPRVVSDGARVLLDSEEAGDEPFMLARNLPGVVVLVDKNRVKAGTYAIRRFGCDTLVLDDGFQYLPLKGRLNLLLVDTTNPFGNGHLLPRGILREPIKHLRRASYVFLTKSTGRRDPELDELIQKHNPGVDVIECAHRPQHLQRVGQAEQQPLDYLKYRRVGAFSGIATPESFEHFLRELGANLIYTKPFHPGGSGPGVRTGAAGRTGVSRHHRERFSAVEREPAFPSSALLSAARDRDHPGRGGFPGSCVPHLFSRTPPARPAWANGPSMMGPPGRPSGSVSRL
jgi:tetraacyldisaccharide 4'-kinase